MCREWSVRETGEGGREGGCVCVCNRKREILHALLEILTDLVRYLVSRFFSLFSNCKNIRTAVDSYNE
jgi:hypothetical protein